MLKYIIIMVLLASCDTPSKKSQAPKEALTEVSEIKTEVKELPMDTFGKAYLMGHFDPKVHPDFTMIDDRYTDKPGLLMRKEAYDAFLEMYEAAKASGISLVIRSATRNFDYQKGIWERKWTGKTALEDGTKLSETKLTDKEKALRILAYSSMPGTSRHHWGTDVDFNSFDNKWFESGQGKAVYEWLDAHAHEYGFVQVYTTKDDKRPNGYNEERWHWSYKPLSGQMLAEASRTIKDSDMAGFLGAQTATEIGIVSNYVLGVSEACFDR